MEDCHSKFCFNWKFGGNVIGWIGIIASIGMGITFIQVCWKFGEDAIIWTIILTSVINLIASIGWLWAIAERKIVWMHIILTWWTLLITIWICFVAFILCNGMRDQFDGNKPYLIRNNPLTAVTLFCSIYYSYAIMCYNEVQKGIQQNRLETPESDISIPSSSENSAYLVQFIATGNI